MKRRELLGGLVATTAAAFLPPSSMASAPPKKCLPSLTNSLQVVLEGPFAICFEKNAGKTTRAYAYVPAEDGPSAKRMHQFHFGGKRDNSKNYKLTLDKKGLSPSSSVHCTEDTFKPFSGSLYGKPKWDGFIQIELPTPNQITYFGPTTKAYFEDGSVFEMPLTHVLLYSVKNIADVSMSCDGFETQSPHPIGDNSGQFYLQVGLPKKSDPTGDLAVEFFNNRLLTAFSNSGVKKLVKIDPTFAGADVECKNGGLILG